MSGKAPAFNGKSGYRAISRKNIEQLAGSSHSKKLPIRNRPVKQEEPTMRPRSMQCSLPFFRTCLFLFLACAGSGTISAQVVDTPRTLYKIAGDALSLPDTSSRVVQRPLSVPELSGIVWRNDRLWIVDYNNHIVRQIQPDGQVKTLAGRGICGNYDSVGKSALFCFPQGVTIDSKNIIYIAELGNAGVRYIVENFLPKETITVVGTSLPGSKGLCEYGVSIRLKAPCAPVAIVFDEYANLYILDISGLIYRFNDLTRTMQIIAGDALIGYPGSTDGTGADAMFNRPMGIALDRRTGNLYVADTGNHTIRKVTPEGVVTTLAGKAGECGTADGKIIADPKITARFCGPRGIAIDKSGNIYVADTGNSTVRKITPDGLVSTVAGTPGIKQTVTGALPGTIAPPLSITMIDDNRLAVTTSNAEVLGINF